MTAKMITPWKSFIGASFDHLVRSREDGLWNGQTNGSGSLEVHGKFKHSIVDDSANFR